MKEINYVFVQETRFKNLQAECLVMCKTFYQQYQWSLTSRRENAQVVINIVEDHFFIALFQELPIRYDLDPKDKDVRRIVKRQLYLDMANHTGKTLPWGLLQGIRPTKLVFKFMHEGGFATITEGETVLKERLKTRYLVSDQMAALAIEVAKHEEPYIPKSVKEASNSFSVYISIPFCPTRCHYCSFPSTKLELWKDSMQEYLNALYKEWEGVMPKLLETKKISTVYIGGGTPTSLSVEELDELLAFITSSLPMDKVREFTVEAGRPDTITREKLLVLKKYHVQRISINPQTMKEETLGRIGRKHTIDQFLTAYHLACELGFERINVDMIVGLPNEGVEDVSDTLDKITKLNPLEITVHTLAIKRSSKIHEEEEAYQLPDETKINEMLAFVKHKLTEVEDYEPYYLYRQKNIAGSHENIGYYKGKEPCIYNIEIMEEIRPIVAFGAGGITKILKADGSLQRSENVKNVQDYINRTEEMIARKHKAIFGEE